MPTSYTTYWDEWARTWEFQALVKARPVAGDGDLAARFMAMATTRVWPEKLDPDAIREIRAMKERAEEVTERRRVEQLFSWGAIAQRTVDLYESLAK